jgi:D-aminopeptidase
MMRFRAFTFTSAKPLLLANIRSALCAILLSGVVGALVCGGTVSFPQAKPRARDLGVPFDGTPGTNNAITDVRGVEVGHTTLISGSGKLNSWRRSRPHWRHRRFSAREEWKLDPVFGGWFTLNGNGEMTGTTWLEDSGFLDGPVMITNTHSVGVVRDAVIAWKVSKKRARLTPTATDWSLPVVAETCR